MDADAVRKVFRYPVFGADAVRELPGTRFFVLTPSGSFPAYRFGLAAGKTVIFRKQASGRNDYFADLLASWWPFGNIKRSAVPLITDATVSNICFRLPDNHFNKYINMYHLKRTDSGNPDFQKLVKELDMDLAIRDGEDHAFFAQFNKIDTIRHVVVAYDNARPVGCGAIKEYDAGTMEVKRMYVPVAERGKGIASCILSALETWAQELGYDTCILETGQKQPEAIALYKKNHYSVIKNYGQYADVGSSVCFEKHLVKA